jgi:hypothetical protein
MWKNVQTGLSGLAGSKKFQAAVLAGAAWALAKVGFDMPPEEIAPIVGPLWLYVFGQGLADFGSKGRAPADAGSKPGA